jgi:DNA-binding MarR family transcriptional regulator
MTSSANSMAYVRFLNLLGALRNDPSAPQLDPLERELLDLLAQRWADNIKVTVLEAMHSAVAGMSPSTVHRRLKTLKAAGLIVQVPDDADNRIKYLMPTDRARDYYDRLGAALRSSGQLAAT